MSFPSLVILDFSSYALRIRMEIGQISLRENIWIDYLDYHYEHCICKALHLRYGVKVVGYIDLRGYEVTSEVIFNELYSNILMPAITDVVSLSRIVLNNTVKVKVMTVGNSIILGINEESYNGT